MRLQLGKASARPSATRTSRVRWQGASTADRQRDQCDLDGTKPYHAADSHADDRLKRGFLFSVPRQNHNAYAMSPM
jgi:hypothetical protein